MATVRQRALSDCRELLDRASDSLELTPGEALHLAEDAQVRLSSLPPSVGLPMRLEAAARAAHAAVLLGRFEEALRIASAGLAIAPEASDAEADPALRDAAAELSVVQARAFARLGHFDASLQTLRAVPEGIGDAVARKVDAGLASCFRRVGQLEEAAAIFERLLAPGVLEGRERVSALINGASTLWQIGRAQDAWAHLESSRALLDAGTAPALWGWQRAMEAWVQLALGEQGRAIAIARAALQHPVADEYAASSLRRALARSLAREEVVSGDAAPGEEAIRILEAVFEDALEGAFGDAPLVAEELAEVCEQRRDLAGALRWERRARELEQERHSRALAQRDDVERLRRELLEAEVEAEQLRHHSDQLRTLNDDLAALGRTRARLLRTLAHDLRTPLTSLLCGIEIHRRVPEERTLSLIEQAANQMCSIVDGTLAADADAMAGQSEAHEVDVARMTRTTARALAGLGRGRGVTLRVSGPDTLPWLTDPTDLDRVLQNLLARALRGCHEGEIVVALRRTMDPSELHIDITGAFVLTPAELERPDETDLAAVSGVGLALAEQLVDRLEGDLHTTSLPDGRSSLRVVLY